MRDIIKESSNRPVDAVYDKFTTFESGHRCVVKLIRSENGIFVTSSGDMYVLKYFFTMFFARRYFKKLKGLHPEEVKGK